MKRPLLMIKDLCITFSKGNKSFQAVKNVNLDIYPGEIVGLVGESGCGKSVTAESILFPHDRITTGSVWFDGYDVLKMNLKELQSIRGKRIGMIFQDPLTSLNPGMRIGKQIQEIIHRHENLSRQDEIARVTEWLENVGISDACLRMRHYPFEFSGGMRQRVMIAIALACNPSLIIADEPTTSLDVTIQAQILTLLKNLCRKHGTSMLFITHDLGVVAGLCDRVAVMREGEVLECGSVEQIFYEPGHPYTKHLIELARK